MFFPELSDEKYFLSILMEVGGTLEKGIWEDTIKLRNKRVGVVGTFLVLPWSRDALRKLSVYPDTDVCLSQLWLL